MLYYADYFWYNMTMAFWEKIINFFRNWFNNLSGEEKRRLVLICTAGFVVLLTFSVIVSMRGSKKDRFPSEPERLRLNLAIPAEEIFMPDEPDFLPGVLLERNRRSSWTGQDALEYWQDPLTSGEEQWREKIEAAIDEFLERVP
jgi:hypothetical protein